VTVIFGYLTHRRGGPGSGMRVQDDGTVELNVDGGWSAIATLAEPARDELRDEVRASGVLDLPERTPRPPNLHDGDAAELWSDVDGRGLHAVIEAWADANPAAAGSRSLVMTLSRLVSAAQAAGQR
jgi:hypothetical protein